MINRFGERVIVGESSNMHTPDTGPSIVKISMVEDMLEADLVFDKQQSTPDLLPKSDPIINR